ncbi:MAG: folylpolyglutamate synthase/dihydrofolate synthase family protein [Planctomycetota bacterium]
MARLSAFTNYEQKMPDNPRAFGLAPMKALLEELRHPGAGIPCIHVAGTNGKGSTTWYCGALVRSTGLKVGVYTSPHLISPCERISINGIPVSPDEFAYSANMACEAAERIAAGGGAKATWFDIVTATALLHFQGAQVHVMVLETGLGGRLDSTNAVESTVSVITRIGMDHTHELGDTLGAIAMEKAGIIREGVPVMSAAQDDEALRVVEEVCRLRRSELSMLGREIRVSIEEGLADIDVGTELYTGLTKSMPGSFQWENAALAVAAVSKLAEKIGMKFGEQDVRFALLNTEVPGRSMAWHDLFLDGAHNPMAMRALTEVLDEKDFGRMRVVVGMCSDKDVVGTLQQLRRHVSRVWCTRLPSSRSMEPKALAALAREALPKLEVTPVESLEEALAKARSEGGDDPILVTGSFYLVGEALKFPAPEGKDD